MLENVLPNLSPSRPLTANQENPIKEVKLNPINPGIRKVTKIKRSRQPLDFLLQFRNIVRIEQSIM